MKKFSYLKYTVPLGLVVGSFLASISAPKQLSPAAIIYPLIIGAVITVAATIYTAMGRRP